MSGGFLPVSAREMRTLGWTQPDFVYVIGDAYVDHPSFGHAIISRVLEAAGYKVAIVSQPDWRDENSVNIFGTPRLGITTTGRTSSSGRFCSIRRPICCSTAWASAASSRLPTR